MSEMEWLQIFGNNLLYHMQTRGMSQRDLAEATDLTQASISRYSSGRQMPGIKAIVNMANALGCTTDELIDFGSMIY